MRQKSDLTAQPDGTHATETKRELIQRAPHAWQR